MRGAGARRDVLPERDGLLVRVLRRRADAPPDARADAARLCIPLILAEPSYLTVAS